ncbi:glycosyltransferase family 4 protein [Williamsia maris]|uniref:Glycosyltransferase involved in cell wall bisynthesis n=1 Tax=Williamsia maris TaxID=72806 RepID=A0ABT1HE28_9NOCA|nr:glycosyltransferase family 4 protein [Williamsia maris]MCP2176515.1 Glycosyltransferase involved in cell wall bisynthesis [Williamsia maris]
MTPTPAPVLFVSHSPQRSGAEKVMLDLVGECARRGIPVAVACPAGPLSESLGVGVRHVRIPHLGRDHTARTRVGALLSMIVAYLGAARVLRAQRDHRIVANSAHVLPALRIARVGGTAWLVHDHVVDRKFRLFIRIGRPLLTRVVAVSPTTAAALDGLITDIHVGRLGVDVPSTPPPPPTAALRTVGTMSVITQWKGLHVFLEAMARLPHLDAEVAGEAFPGDVAYADGLRLRATSDDLADRVSFPGRVRPGESLARWAVHVSASVKPEAGPLTVLEAMAAGVPVVATDHGGPQQFLAEGRGILVEPDDPAAMAAGIGQLLEDRTLREDMSRDAHAYVALHHDRRTTVPALLDLVLGPADDENEHR